MPRSAPPNPTARPQRSPLAIEGAFACYSGRCELFHSRAVQYVAAREPPPIYTGFTDETQQTERRSKMNSLSTTGQAETRMGLTREQLQVTIVLLVLIAAMAIAMVGATIYVTEQAYSTDSSSLMAGMTRCPRGCPI
jgi:hypothetical protein